MTFETLFAWNSLIYLVSFICSMASPQFKNRHHMMAFKFLGDGLSGIYLFTLGGNSGGCAALIAGTGALVQALTPNKYLRQTRLLRTSIALTLCAASIYFVYKTPLDILPISMVIICRFAELHPNPQRVRLVYFLTCFPWLLYHFMNGFYIPLIATSFSCASLLLSLLRYHRPKTANEMN